MGLPPDRVETGSSFFRRSSDPGSSGSADAPLVEIEVGKQGNGCGCEIAVARQCGEKFERDPLHRLSPGSSGLVSRLTLDQRPGSLIDDWSLINGSRRDWQELFSGTAEL